MPSIIPKGRKDKRILKTRTINRRKFVKSITAGSAGLIILPSGVLSGKNAPSNKLNIALIGVYGRALAHYRGLKNENVVALCDVDENHLALATKEFPKAKHYFDWQHNTVLNAMPNQTLIVFGN